jgi:hypothetical protein
MKAGERERQDRKHMRFNSRALSMRDPALAAAVGAFGGSDFGNEGFGDESYLGGVDSMAGDFGGDFGYDFGSEFGGAPGMIPAKPTAQQALGAWNALRAKRAKAVQRYSKLEPNAGSEVDIERYSFSLSEDFTLGTAAAFGTDMSGTPDTTFRPQVITANAPAAGFAYLSNLKMANVNVTVGPGEEDLFGISGPSWGRTMDMPTLSTSNRANADGRITTFTPPGYTPAATYTLVLNFKGPSRLAGGGAR